MPLSKWCLSIYDTPLSRFEECILKGNLSALIILGFPTEQQLTTAWNTIIEEYTDAMGDGEYNMYLNLYKEVEMMRADYNGIIILISALRKFYSAYFRSELSRILRMDLTLNENDVPTYMAELDKCERRAKGLKINLDLKQIAFDQVKNKIEEKDETKIDRNYFTSILVTLGRFNNYRLTKDIFVNEYCEQVKQFSLHLEQINKQNK
jgi:hypothetical protein